MDENMSGKQLAEVLKFLAGRVQASLDDGQEIVDELKTIAAKVEERDDNG